MSTAVDKLQSNPAGWTAKHLVDQFGGELIGDASKAITKLGTLADADQQCLSFLANPKYRGQLVSTRAAIVLIPAAAASDLPSNCTGIVCDQPYLYYAKVSRLFAPAKPLAGIHPSAVIEAGVHLGTNVSIGAFVHVEQGARVGDGAVLMSHSVVGRNASIGANTVLHPHVSVYHDCEVGQDCILHSGVVVGADGFGFAPAGDQGWQKIEQVGRVMIGDDVEIGANTTIDRGAISDTVVGRGCKLDNQIQIAHNVVIGEFTVIAACVGIAGSATIGKRCLIGGAAGILGHLSIADGVTISAMSLVSRTISEVGMYTGIFPLMPNREWEKAAVLVRQIDDMRNRIKSLEAAIKTLTPVQEIRSNNPQE